MDRYEYKWVSASDMDQINALGDQGWRVTHTEPETETQGSYVLMEHRYS